jgi:cysteine dioxygenase type I
VCLYVDIGQPNVSSRGIVIIAPWRSAEPSQRWKRKGSLAPLELVATAHRFAGTASSLPGMDDPCERCWRTIAADHRCEAWVVAWPVGGAIELHNHGNSAGAVVVVSGTLVETSVRHSDHRQLAMSSLSVGTGEHVAFGPGYVHDFVNHGPGPALSVHVYSPALHAMTYFDWSDGQGLVRIRTEEYREGLLVG